MPNNIRSIDEPWESEASDIWLVQYSDDVGFAVVLIRTHELGGDEQVLYGPLRPEDLYEGVWSYLRFDRCHTTSSATKVARKIVADFWNLSPAS